LDEGVEVSRTCQRRSWMNMMVGFVQMERKQLYGENAEIRTDWRNVANELGNLWKVSWC